MPNTLVTDRKFFNKLKNGETFSLNTSDFATHLKGGGITEQKAVFTINVSWSSAASVSLPFTFTTSGDFVTVTRDSGNWLTDGWSVGDVMDVTFTAGGPFEAEVITVDDEVLIIEDAALAAAIGAGGTSDTFLFRGKSDLTGLIWKFGFIENDANASFNSPYDGTTLSYSFKDVGLDTGGGRPVTFVDGEFRGSPKGSQTGTMKARFVQAIDTYVQQFEIEHTFIINPYFLDGELTDIQNGLQPDRFEGDQSIRYVSNFEFRRVLTDPNSSKTGDDTFLLGSVGGFGENYNGFNNIYSISNLSYLDVPLAASTDGLIVGTTTRVNFSVLSSDSTFTASSIVMAYHSFLPTAQEYDRRVELFRDVWIYDSKRQTAGVGAVSSDNIKLLTVTFINSGQIDVQFDVEFSGAEQNILTTDSNYFLGIEVTDNALSTNSSDKVVLLIDARAYEKDSDVSGLLDYDRNDIYNHPNDISGAGFTDNKGWIEDKIVCVYRVHTDITLDAVIKGHRVKLVAFNSTTGDEFTLDTFTYNLNSTFVPVGANLSQQFNSSPNRGWNVAADDQFNLASFRTDNRVGDDQFFNGETAMQINWAKWITLPGANAIFFDNTKDQNGLNKNAANYSLINDYAIHIVLEFDMSIETGTPDENITTYRRRSPAFVINDYDVDSVPAPDYTSVTKTFAPDGTTEITPSILTDANTIIRTIWTQVSGPLVSAADFWAWHHLEENGSLAENPFELSSLRDTFAGNFLIPLIGETQVKLSIDGGDLIQESRIDFTKLNKNKSYDISSRIGSISGTPPVPANVKREEDDTPKVTEAGDFKILE